MVSTLLFKARYLYRSSHCIYRDLFSVRNAEIMRQLLRRSGGARNICRRRICTSYCCFVDTKHNTITESLLYINSNYDYWKLNTAHGVSATSISFNFHSLRKKNALVSLTSSVCITFCNNRPIFTKFVTIVKEMKITQIPHFLSSFSW